MWRASGPVCRSRVACCERDLEGIVAKPKQSPYVSDRPVWIKVKNPGYSEAEGRRELFEERLRR